MTDEGGGVAASGMMAKMSTGELLMGLGAAWLFVVNYVIGNRIADEYFGSVVVTVSVLALIVLVSIYAAKSGKTDSGWGSMYPWAATTAVWGIFVLAVLDLLNGLINDFSSSGEFYEITFYIAAAVAASGAYMQSQGN